MKNLAGMLKQAQQMQTKMQAKMQAEMQTIINTEDRAKRLALFAAHKEKMKGMMGMMQNMHGSDCNKMQRGGVAHQGETD